MKFKPDTKAPPHMQNAQWVIILDGEMEITIAGETKVLTKRDSNSIEKDVIHPAGFKKGYKDITLFDQKDRYKFLLGKD